MNFDRVVNFLTKMQVSAERREGVRLITCLGEWLGYICFNPAEE